MADALRVSVLFKGKELKSRTFAKDRILIGRQPDCDLRLNSSEVSRHHVCIQRREACGYLLCDLGSRNGTFIGDERITLVPIREGGQARIGRYELTFRLLDVPWEQGEELATPRIDRGEEATLRDGEADVAEDAVNPELEATAMNKFRAWLGF
jgi:pSer/pThr/pTyr-binding forkhead associated (FHA) protein